MALEKMQALEARIRGLVELVQDLKRKNSALEGDLRAMRERLANQEDLSRRWEEERAGIRLRIKKVLGEMDVLDSLEGARGEE